MDRRLKPFRSTTPCERCVNIVLPTPWGSCHHICCSHQINAVQFSPTGDAIIVCPGSSQVRLLLGGACIIMVGTCIRECL